MDSHASVPVRYRSLHGRPPQVVLDNIANEPWGEERDAAEKAHFL